MSVWDQGDHFEMGVFGGQDFDIYSGLWEETVWCQGVETSLE